MSTDSLAHEFDFTVEPSHPSLPGHFPGRPVVPGVLVLDEVLAGAERWLQRGLQVRAIPQVKFNAALLPEQRARVRLSLTSRQLRFTVHRDEHVIAQGLFGLDT